MKKIIRRWMYKTNAFYRNRIKESVFDYRIVLGFLLIFGLIVVIFYPHQNYFCFPNHETVLYISEIVFNTSFILFGIIISLIILSFQLFNTNFGRYAYIGFFKNKPIKWLLTFYTINLFFSYYVLAYLKGETILNSYSNALFVTLIFLNFILLVTLFPISASLIKQSKSIYNIKKIVSLIDEKWILESDFYMQFEEKRLDIIDKNPITLLEELFIQAIKSDDKKTVDLILDSLYIHLKDTAASIKIAEVSEAELKNNPQIIQKQTRQKHRRANFNSYFYESYQNFLRNVMPHVVKSEEYKYANLLLIKRLELEIYIIENEIITNNSSPDTFKYDYFNFSFDFKEFFERAVILGNPSIAERGVEIYGKYCEKIITVLFPKYFKEYDYNDYKSYSQEKMYTMSILSSNLEEFAEKCLLYNKKTIFSKLLNLFYLQSTIISSQNSESVKRHLIHIMNQSKDTVLKKYLESGISKLTFLTWPYSSFFVEEEIDKLKSKSIFNQAKKATQFVYIQGLLNNMIINLWKAIAMHFIKKIQEDNITIYKKLLIEVIEFFIFLRNLTPEIPNTYHKDIYIKLHTHLGYILDTYSHIDINDDDISNKFSIANEGFDKIEVYRRELESVGFLPDDSII